MRIINVFQYYIPISNCAGAGVAVERMSALSHEGVVSVIHALVSSIAGADTAPDAPLSQAGLDSLASVELRNDLSR